jgi:mannose-6-phosphate isomerase-like protein (cupin superfamily)
VTERRIVLSLGASRELVIAIPEEAGQLEGAVLGAVGFLAAGLAGASASDLARVSAKLLAHELPRGSTATVSVIEAGSCIATAHVAAHEPFPEEESTFGRVDIVDEVDDFGVYRLRIAPSQAIPTHEHRTMDEWEYALRGTLYLQGEPVTLGEAVRWPLRHPHRWENRGNDEAVVLCIDRPRFDARDEVVVDAATLERCPIRFRPHPAPRTP